jgi:hypothetical protein
MEMIMAKSSALNIVTANHLLEGASIFLGEDGWTTDHHAAKLAASPDEAAALEALGRADEAANKVVGVYLVAVEMGEDGRIEPVHFREKLRVRARPSFWPDGAKSRPSFRDRRSEDARHVSL